MAVCIRMNSGHTVRSMTYCEVLHRGSIRLYRLVLLFQFLSQFLTHTHNDIIYQEFLFSLFLSLSLAMPIA